ncbi:RNA polymerase sporulation sigma factor SigH [Metabacillus sediminilitoris]|uniref:RNA polymerase sporulation sigma factor SigH n=1 Tax=Metabacillus sediminilitoris TaxID=2567941 RepID=A0A4S4BQA9_9BACI|nr:RNA polymerase sporulation sigma factor SigH [Metabacillus sediminilitoris]QGQ45544.1 RNA polymerase sporulation sigma factor SigH [Metabacillus sediminilitoris]THF76609.1 RNA polymerase sporulation sigma factor SigH [Metabacillus sediminilitoris]
MSVNIEVQLIDHYAKLEDKVLVELAQNGDSESLVFLINKYQHFVRMKTRPYFLIGGDKEDLVQEGMIGLYKAIRDFREEKIVSFHSFADLCITRQIITAIKTANRQKHGPLNSSISLDKPLTSEESNYTLMDMIPGEKITNPEAFIINQEQANDIELKIIELLSDLERRVLTLYMDGQSYAEISKELNTHVKSIDNALQRVKRKLERHLDIRKVI